MFTQLPEEKKVLIKPLYKKHQPNFSALSCYFEGKMPGKVYVDDVNAPTKAIWACDKDNVESDRLAQHLGYVNPVEYEFVYLEPKK